MREYEVTIGGDAIRQGLRKKWTASRNSGGLVTCQNVEVDENGLTIYDEMPFAVPYQYLITEGIDQLAWPDPQVFQGRRHSFMVYKRQLYIINEEDWIPLRLDDIRSVSNVNTPKTPNLGSLWEFIDMGEAWMFVNGRSAVMYYLFEKMTGGTDYVRCYNSIWVQTGCEFRGRMLLGGFEEEHSWHPTLKTYIQALADDRIVNFNTGMNLHPGVVMWSPIGFDLFWMFFPSIATSNPGWQGVDVDGDTFLEDYSGSSWIHDMMLRNDFGWMPMPWKGYVLHTKPLGKAVMVYGEGGISFLYPSTDLATFGRQDFFMKYGINNKGAAGGNDKKQLFLDSWGDLWLVELERDYPKYPQKLGYREFFKGNLDLIWKISYDEHEDRFYISNGMETFMLSQHGLSSTKQLVTSVAYKNGVSSCMGSQLTDQNIELVYDSEDLYRSEIDTIEWVKIGADLSEYLWVAVDYKYTDNEAWTRSDYTQVNNEGAAYIGIAAKAFRICIKSVLPEDGIITEVRAPDWITYTFKKTDKRFTRGINVRQANTGQ